MFYKAQQNQWAKFLQDGTVKEEQDAGAGGPALVLTQKVSGTFIAPATSSVNTSSFTTDDDTLLGVIVVAQLVGGSGSDSVHPDITVAGGGHTYTALLRRGTLGFYCIGYAFFTATISLGSTFQLTIDCGAEDISTYHVSAFDLLNYNNISPVGVTGFDDTLASNGADSVTLSGAPASTSIIVGGRAGGTAGTGTHSASPGSGITELHDLNATDGSGLQTQYRPAGSTSTTFDWADTATGTAVNDHACLGFAIEFKKTP